MTYKGRIKNGKVVIDDEVSLPEGAEVWVDLREIMSKNTRGEQAAASLVEKLLKHAGRVQDLPQDAARNHDHYLYGTPRR